MSALEFEPRPIRNYNFRDLTGERFGLLIARECVGRAMNRKAVWLCECDCGNTAFVESVHLTRGATRSCGCFARAQTIKIHTTHGQYGTPLYKRWRSMIARCTDPSSPSYRYYGGRGIRVCDEWTRFENFAKDMGGSFEKELSIDRINPDGNYDPSNCRWANVIDQANNKRTNRLIEFNGRTLTMAQTARMYGIKYETLQRRLGKGWTIEKALTYPIRRKQYELSN